MICPKCGTDNRPENDYCEYCTARLTPLMSAAVSNSLSRAGNGLMRFGVRTWLITWGIGLIVLLLYFLLH